MQELTAFDEWLEEVQRGEIRGERRGEIRGKIASLLRFGRKQFGEPHAVIEATLSAITDPERLDRILDAAFTAKSWHELLAAL